MIDLLIVLAFVVYAVTHGLRARRKASQSLNEYFLAGQSIRGWRAGFSMAATQFAADTPLLVMGLIATGGIFRLWRLWIYGLAFVLLAFVFAACWRRAGVLTDAELTEVRYSGRGVLPLRVLKAVYYGTIVNCVVMAMVLIAGLRIAEVFLPWHLWLPGALYDPLLNVVQALGLELGGSATELPGAVATSNNLISMLAILAFTTLYSMTGGLRSVVSTDVLQFTLAMAGTASYAWFVVAESGGLGGLTERVVALYGQDEAARMLSFGPPSLTGEALLPFLTLVGLQWLFQMNADGTGYLAQRAMGCRSERDARVAGIVFAWAQILVRSLLWLLIGVGLLVLYPFAPEASTAAGFAADREVLFVTGVDELLPTGLRGLMLVGLLAALASTLDTHLNWGASYWSNDIYQRLVCQRWLRRQATNRELVRVARASNVLVLVIALIVMAHLGSIQTAWFVSLLFGAGVGSVLVLRWLWERINLWSEIATIAASLVTAPLLLWRLGAAVETEWIRLAAMALVTTGAAIGVAFITPPTDPGVLQRFYQRVQPPGFWGATTRALGHSPRAARRALSRGLVTAALTALSLFAVLIGLGRLLIPPPGASVAWTLGYLLAGLALIPAWWRAARQLEIAQLAAPSTITDDAPSAGDSRMRHQAGETIESAGATGGNRADHP